MTPCTFYDYLTVTSSVQLLTAVKSVSIALKMVACENIIMAKFKMREVVLSAQECGILCSNPGGITCMEHSYFILL